MIRSSQSGLITQFYQISGLEPYGDTLEAEKPTRSESGGGRREAKIRVLAAPEPVSIGHTVGLMFWLRRNRFCGSNLRFSSTIRL